MLLGKKIGFPIGVPASSLTANAQWIQYLSRNGFNVITYKTVRSRQREPSVPPNWIFLPQVTKPLEFTLGPPAIVAEMNGWVEPGSQNVSTANSFGVPSSSPQLWQADLEESLSVIHEDQILIVSVMGDDYEETGDQAAVADDYASLVKMAEAAGASVIELNLSCPNSLMPGEGVKPPLCQDVELTRRIVETVRDRAEPETQVLAKLAYSSMAETVMLVEAIGPLVDGVSGINTVQSTISDGNGRPIFPGRPLAGISGVAIRNHALDFIRDLARLRLELGLRFEIVGMGGVTDVASFEALYSAGASAVQSASGVLANPFLAWDCVDNVGATLPQSPELIDEMLKKDAKGVIIRVVAAFRSADRYAVASKLPLPPSQSFALLDELVSEGELISSAEHGGLYEVAHAT